MAEDQNKKDEGSARCPLKESIPAPKIEIVPPTFEIVVKSEKGRKAIVSETEMSSSTE